MKCGGILSQIHTAMADYIPQVPMWPPPHDPGRPQPRSSVSVRFQTAAVRIQTAAVRIQSAARGLLARKALRDLQALDAEVGAVERHVQRSIDLLLADERERLRVQEMLMAVLLRLDSVPGARGYRSKVIRRAITLQDSLDAIAGGAAAAPAEEEEEDAEAEEALAVERLAEENEKLKGVVEGLLEESAAMSRRVGELERKLRRLRRRRGRRGVVLKWRACEAA